MITPYQKYAGSNIKWVEAIPEDWKSAPLYTVASESKLSNKGMIEDNLLSLSFGRIKRKSIDTQGGLLPASFETYQIVNENDIIFRLTDLQNDKRSLRSAQCMERGIITSAYVAVTPNAIRPRYLHYLMRAYDETKVFYNLGAGMRQSLKYDELKRLPILLPPELTQQAIEKFLDRETQRIDSLIEEKQTFIKLLKEKRQALISHVVTKGLNPNVEMQDSGIEWIGQVPKHWSVVQLKRLIDSIEQGWSPECLATPAKNERWGVLKSGAVNGGVYSQDENKELPETLSPRPEIEVKVGDLIMSRASGSRELIGSAAYVYATRERLMLSDKLFRLHCKEEVDAEFVAIALGSFPLRRQIELAIGGAEGLANNLSQANIKKLLIPKPPKTEQEAITSHIKSVSSKIEDLIIETNNSIALLKERKTSLISAAVTGKIDVREAV
ncbi:restriction endonuclease subunit S [Pseudoalteromonas sp. M8]|uniref:restriction endonuclease subunit S n=1 Tax=Pseudoalteromonas sp. M8 TaxID=2692624 RepID=UPI001BA81883|nr:restriction endonuclease subunit S [Pseudoalteromonas sp. M8]QUI68866.1 restriction endonuclease subunit S [Pseudoalteromonas sp. M8]